MWLKSWTGHVVRRRRQRAADNSAIWASFSLNKISSEFEDCRAELHILLLYLHRLRPGGHCEKKLQKLEKEMKMDEDSDADGDGDGRQRRRRKRKSCWCRRWRRSRRWRKRMSCWRAYTDPHIVLTNVIIICSQQLSHNCRWVLYYIRFQQCLSFEVAFSMLRTLL